MKTLKTTVTIMLLFISFISAKGKDKPATIITQDILIDAGVEKAWQVLGPDFANAYKWATSIKHSQAFDSDSFNGSACTERGCDVSGMGNIREKILEYSDNEHVLHYQVTEGMPKMISHMTNYWKLTETSDGKTRLEMKMEMKTTGLMGGMMKGMMKKKMTRMSKEVTEEFKYYVENGSPHPRKEKSSKKK